MNTKKGAKGHDEYALIATYFDIFRIFFVFFVSSFVLFVFLGCFFVIPGLAAWEHNEHDEGTKDTTYMF